MGRTEKSQGLAPPAIRKDVRAKQARHITNKVVPAVLASSTRARKGADGSELIANPGPGLATTAKEDGDEGGDDAKYIKRKGQGRRKAKSAPEDEPSNKSEVSKSKSKRRNDSLSEPLSNMALSDPPPPPAPLQIRLVTTDSLTAARALVPKGRNQTNPCVLNMASPLRPGGGVLTGATSQEEYLCARTTLLPSLKESFYRLPELGGIYTHDVLVLRNHLPLGDAKGELGPTERWWIDVISAGMLRFPDLEGGEEEEKRLNTKDRRLVEAKMRAVLRIACARGVRRIVLGAWGCGAYGNPVRDVAEAWRTVLLPQPDGKKRGKNSSGPETWNGLQEVIFAISNRKMAREFASAVGGGLEVEKGPGGEEDDDEADETDEMAEELRTKIAEMEGQIDKVWNADLKQRMTVILEGLKSQLEEREGGRSADSDADEDGQEDESGVESDADSDEGAGEEEFGSEDFSGSEGIGGR